MKLIVGLGNPGPEYALTRHNLGARMVEEFAAEEGIKISKKRFRSRWGDGIVGSEKVGLLFPETFMNRSGEAVSEAVNFFGLKTEDLLVVHDDIDLPLGKMKIDFDAGAAGHRGVQSVSQMLGSQQYSRLRLGIGRPATKEEVEEYVLMPFSAEDEVKLKGEKTACWALMKQFLSSGRI